MPPNRPWRVQQPNPEDVRAVVAQFGFSEPVAACCVNRGLKDAETLEPFLRPQLSELSSPGQMADLDRAVDRIISAIAAKERVAIFGDYDVDGITSAAVVLRFLEMLDCPCEVRIGDRFEGYGLTPSVVEDFHKAGCSLVVVLDCGTSDILAAKRAVELGLEVIVIDHHGIEGEYPPVHAFVNPKRSDCAFGDTTMAAVGLAFYFAARLRTRLVERGYLEQGAVDVRELLDLVALGTVADVAPLRGNNRILVHHGLLRLATNQRPGILALLRSADVRTRRFRSDHISFQLAPRLNAAGRLKNAKDALDLLVAQDTAAATAGAAALEKLVLKRRILEKAVFEAALTQIPADLPERQPVVVAGEGWHRGVVGIVAARLAERTGRPALVVSLENGRGVGSARGAGQIDLHQCLASASEALLRFGGHRDAAGFSLDEDRLQPFVELVQAHGKEHWRDEFVVQTQCDFALHPSQLQRQLLTEIDRLAPFGEGNREPVFEIDGLYVLSKKVVGQDHLKLTLKTPSGTVAAFGPKMAHCVDDLPALICVAAALSRDEWRGSQNLELRLVEQPVAGI